MNSPWKEGEPDDPELSFDLYGTAVPELPPEDDDDPLLPSLELDSE